MLLTVVFISSKGFNNNYCYTQLKLIEVGNLFYNKN